MDIKELGRNFIDAILSLRDKLLDRIPENKRRIVIYSLGGLVLLCIILIVIAAGSGKRPGNPQSVVTGTGIPTEELFYAAEPDFLPSLLLERWPSAPWTAEEVRPFWTDPVTGFEERWRETAEAVIDKLMEGVH